MASLERFVLFIPEKLNSIRLVTNNNPRFLLDGATRRVRSSAKVCTPPFRIHDRNRLMRLDSETIVR